MFQRATIVQQAALLGTSLNSLDSQLVSVVLRQAEAERIFALFYCIYINNDCVFVQERLCVCFVNQLYTLGLNE